MPAFQKHQFNDFSGGMNTIDPPEKLQPNQCFDLKNMEYVMNNVPQTRRGTTRLSEDNALGVRTTSIHHFPRSGGASDIIATYTDGSGHQQIRKMSGGKFLTGGGTLITPGFVTTANQLYQWVNFKDLMIGVNGLGSTLNPIAWDGITANAGLLSALPGFVGTVADGGRWITTWGNRVWIAPVSGSQNNIIACAVGNPLDWNLVPATAADAYSKVVGGIREGDYITGLWSHRGRLIVFKRHSIYKIEPQGLETDATQYDVKLITQNCGCTSGFTIQTVMNDLIFLSDRGFCSLAVVEETGDFSVKAVLSRNIAELIGHGDGYGPFASTVDEENSQYLCSLIVGDTVNSQNNVTYCMDFKDPSNLKWSRWDGKAVGSVLGNVVDNGTRRVYIGGYGDAYRYGDEGILHDADDSVIAGTTHEFYESSIVTKDYDLGSSLQKKLWDYWRLYLESLADALYLNISYTRDQTETKFTSKDFRIRTGPAVAGMIWGIGHWGDRWGSAGGPANPKIVRRFTPRRADSMQFEIKNTEIDQGFAVRELIVEAAELNRKRVDNIP